MVMENSKSQGKVVGFFVSDKRTFSIFSAIIDVIILSNFAVYDHDLEVLCLEFCVLCQLAISSKYGKCEEIVCFTS